jgi:hypothetical protein
MSGLARSRRAWSLVLRMSSARAQEAERAIPAHGPSAHTNLLCYQRCTLLKVGVLKEGMPEAISLNIVEPFTRSMRVP